MGRHRASGTAVLLLLLPTLAACGGAGPATGATPESTDATFLDGGSHELGRDASGDGGGSDAGTSQGSLKAGAVVILSVEAVVRGRVGGSQTRLHATVGQPFGAGMSSAPGSGYVIHWGFFHRIPK